MGPIRFEGEVIGLFAVTSDVTEQRSAGADRERFFSLSLDMLVVITPSGHLKRVNPAFGETLGYEAQELLETRFMELVHPDDRARTQEAFESLDAPIKRIAAPDTPVPFSPPLEKAFIPQVDDVVAGLRDLAEY